MHALEELRDAERGPVPDEPLTAALNKERQAGPAPVRSEWSRAPGGPILGRAGRLAYRLSPLVLLLLLATPVTPSDDDSLALLDARVELLEREVQLLTHNNLLQEGKICDGVQALNENLGVAFNNSRLLDMAREDQKLCRSLYERAAEYRATRPFIRMAEIE
ncbi:MAG: hypothetical protein F4230_07540 [Holophagales bacterium]|nr:hypothetical protein [Holophagales bacterium]MYF04824.1 hypothetical protein [Holophagales bacterium]MYJ26545.1 hypothetical protein [Holophagales bacterium]